MLAPVGVGKDQVGCPVVGGITENGAISGHRRKVNVLNIGLQVVHYKIACRRGARATDLPGAACSSVLAPKDVLVVGAVVSNLPHASDPTKLRRRVKTRRRCRYYFVLEGPIDHIRRGIAVDRN